jgi:hypothetical protein
VVRRRLIKSGYHLGLNKFIDWAIKEKLYLGDKPKFECVDASGALTYREEIRGADAGSAHR